MKDFAEKKKAAVPYRRWRHDVRRVLARGRFLETYFGELLEAHPEAKFEIRDWHRPTIDWTEHDEDIRAFAARVKLVAKMMKRPPDTCGDQGSYLKNVDLLAKWRVDLPKGSWPMSGDRAEVMVRAMWAKGCKLDPRVTPTDAVEAVVHPECRALLVTLEESAGIV